MRTWTLVELADLLRLLPREVPWPGSHLRCVRAARSQGRYVREDAPEAFGDVTLQAWPAESFLLTCAYRWPEEVGSAEADILDRALLEGLMEGACRMEQPPWGSSLVCSAVGYRAGQTDAAAVRVAACMAVLDVVERGEWVVEGQPPKDVA